MSGRSDDGLRRLTRWGLRALGLAGVAGVAATGVLIARSERNRRALTPDDVRTRLHQRLAEADGPDRPARFDR
ncbi:MAG: hypothetical protein JNL54_10105 [Kineosporiaceae bacterium]|nr:hypothetical protein [Kineosporiaceae bacterium]